MPLIHKRLLSVAENDKTSMNISVVIVLMRFPFWHLHLNLSAILYWWVGHIVLQLEWRGVFEGYCFIVVCFSPILFFLQLSVS